MQQANTDYLVQQYQQALDNNQTELAEHWLKQIEQDHRESQQIERMWQSHLAQMIDDVWSR